MFAGVLLTGSGIRRLELRFKAPTVRRVQRPGATMRRREFITLLGGAAVACPLPARAQQPATVRKVGFLYPGPGNAVTVRLEAFLEGLRNAGYRVPEHLEILPRFADGDPARLPSLAAELVDRNADVIAAVSTAAANAVRAATTAIPIVGLDLETDQIARKLAGTW